jgi:hypothetical protein
MVRIILVNKKLGAKTKRPQVLVCYDLMEGLIYEEEDLIFETKPEIFSINTITLLEKMVSLLSVGVLKIRSTEEFGPNQGTSDQTTVKMTPSIVKLEDFCVKLEVSLEDKVYSETYYHHSQDDIQVDETPTKI